MNYKYIFINNNGIGSKNYINADFTNELYIFNIANNNFIIRVYGEEGKQFIFGFGITLYINTNYIPATRIILFDRYDDHLYIQDCYDTLNGEERYERVIYSIAVLK